MDHIFHRDNQFSLLFVFFLSLVSPCRDHDECVSVLAGLRLWHSQQLQGGLQGYILNPVFKDNLRIALLGGYVPVNTLFNHRAAAVFFFKNSIPNQTHLLTLGLTCMVRRIQNVNKISLLML